MNHVHHEKAGLKPATLRPFGPWLDWGWHGLFVKGHTSNQFVRFCLVGASGVLVNYLVMRGLFDGLGLHYGPCTVTAYLVASVNNFIWNKLFTFRNEVRGLWPIVKQYLRFLSVILLGLAITLGAVIFLVEFMAMDPVLANLLGVLLATVSNFLGNKLFAFRRH
jgi:dolichol-phosphate mannosyltransferase